MNKQTILTFCIFFFSSIYIQAQFSISQNCNEAYRLIKSLQLDKADSILNLESKSGGNVVCVSYLKDYNSFVRLFVSQDYELYEKLKSIKSENFEEIESLSDTCRYKKWMLGNMHLRWALVKVMFGDYISAAFEFNSAYQLIEKNTKAFPDFRLNDLSQSVLKIIVGLIPEQYNWFLSLLSMEGNIEGGKSQLFSFLSASKSDSVYQPYFQEALFYAAFIEMNIHTDQGKIIRLKKEIENVDEAVILISFVKLNLFMRTGENQKALDLLEKIRLESQNTYPFYYLNYLHGECLLRAQRFEESISKLDLFTMYFKGENYLKDAWRKKAWAAFMKKDSVQFINFMQEVKSNGVDKIDIDKEALAEAESDQLPDKDLLLSRLLFDGGYYNEALHVLYYTDTADFSIKEKVNYIYRIARINQQMKDIEKAKEYYRLTIDLGASLNEYFAANASLQLGEIYESEGNQESAREAYATCLQMDYETYKKSINRRAREGLKRVLD